MISRRLLLIAPSGLTKTGILLAQVVERPVYHSQLSTQHCSPHWAGAALNCSKKRRPVSPLQAPLCGRVS